MNHYLLTSLCATVAAVAACGGGGSEAPAPGPAPAPLASSYDAQKAWVNLMTTTRSWTLAGVGSDGKSYQLTLATEPGGTAVFPVTGATASKANLRNRMMQDSTLRQDTLNEQFLDADYRMLGSRVSNSGVEPQCSKTEVIAALPPSGVGIGGSGPLYAATTLSECSAAGETLGTSVHTWSLVGSDGVAYLCIASRNRFVGNMPDLISETCVETDAAGQLGARARITLVLPDLSLIAATN